MSKTKNIVFVHGAWHGAWCWKKYFVPYFQTKGYHCHTFDLPLHEKPGKVKGINAMSMMNYVEALKKQLSTFPEKPILIGHSMGGLVIQKYLETDTAQMAILLTPAPPHGVLRNTFKFLGKSYAYPALLGFNLYKLIDTPSKAKWAFFSETLPQEELLEYTHQLCSESYLAFLGMTFPRIKINYHTQIPMLVVAAKDDNIFTIQDNQKTAQKYKADLEVVNAIAHDVMLDTEWQKVADIIDTWIHNNRNFPN